MLDCWTALRVLATNNEGRRCCVPGALARGAQFRLKKKTTRSGSGSDVSSKNSGHTASSTTKLGREHSQSSRADGLEGLTTSCRALGGEGNHRRRQVL